MRSWGSCGIPQAITGHFGDLLLLRCSVLFCFPFATFCQQMLKHFWQPARYFCFGQVSLSFSSPFCLPPCSACAHPSSLPSRWLVGEPNSHQWQCGGDFVSSGLTSWPACPFTVRDDRGLRKAGGKSLGESIRVSDSCKTICSRQDCLQITLSQPGRVCYPLIIFGLGRANRTWPWKVRMIWVDN